MATNASDHHISGFLEKQSAGFFERFQERWFLLKDGQLAYGDDEGELRHYYQSFRVDNKEFAADPDSCMIRLRVVDGDDTGLGNMSPRSPPPRPGASRELLLRAEDAEYAREWVECLELAEKYNNEANPGMNTSPSPDARQSKTAPSTPQPYTPNTESKTAPSTPNTETPSFGTKEKSSPAPPVQEYSDGVPVRKKPPGFSDDLYELMVRYYYRYDTFCMEETDNWSEELLWLSTCLVVNLGLPNQTPDKIEATLKENGSFKIGKTEEDFLPWFVKVFNVNLQWSTKDPNQYLDPGPEEAAPPET